MPIDRPRLRCGRADRRSRFKPWYFEPARGRDPRDVLWVKVEEDAEVHNKAI